MDEDNEYGLSDSDNYEEGGKILLGNSKQSSFPGSDDDDDQDELYGVGSGGEDEAMSDVDMGSDIEDRDDDRMPDDRAWGQRRKNFYNTDYVDKDYAGTLNATEEEAAKLEEEEAKNIQKRLMEQLNDADFSLAGVVEGYASVVENKAEVIETDISLLTKRQKLDLFAKEAPEFANLVEDFIVKLTEAKERIMPVLNLVKEGKLVKNAATEFLETKLSLILNYCTNITFYILLKTKRIPVKNHPVMKCLFRYRQLLLQLQAVHETIITPQVDKILEAFNASEDFGDKENVPSKKTLKRKKLLKLLKKTASLPDKPEEEHFVDEDKANYEVAAAEVLDAMTSDDDVEEGAMEGVVNANGEGGGEKMEKRAITYEMAKNKGLTPKRSKEQRNPRVKHRNKYKKAKIRRRGQVRMPRSEIPVYGGEPTGIKIGVKKGRKLL